MTAAIELDLLLAWLNRPGATPAPTAAGDPPTRPGDGPWKPGGPSITTRLDDGDRDNAARLGHLQYLLGEMQHIAGRDGCPADLANLIDQARQVTDLRRAA